MQEVFETQVSQMGNLKPALTSSDSFVAQPIATKTTNITERGSCKGVAPSLGQRLFEAAKKSKAVPGSETNIRRERDFYFSIFDLGFVFGLFSLILA